MTTTETTTPQPACETPPQPKPRPEREIMINGRPVMLPRPANESVLKIFKTLPTVCQLLPSWAEPVAWVLCAANELNKVASDVHDKTEELVIREIRAGAPTGLLLGTALGHANLIPRANQKGGMRYPRFNVNYKGFLHLAHVTKQLAGWAPRIVFVGEKFIHTVTQDGDQIHHEPSDNPPMLLSLKEGLKKVDAAYCTYQLTNGYRSVVVIKRDRLHWMINDYASRNSNYDSQFLQQMIEKTLANQMRKFVPHSPEMMSAAVLMDGDYNDDSVTPPQPARKGFGLTSVAKE